MRKLLCPRCERSRRPYNVDRVAGATYRTACPGCGQQIIFTMDHIVELAPVDIKSAYTPEGLVVRIVDEKRGYQSTPTRLRQPRQEIPPVADVIGALTEDEIRALEGVSEEDEAPDEST